MTIEERNDFIMEHLNKGDSLSDVQKMLVDEYKMKITYFDLRMLASDLMIDWHKQDKPEPVKPKEEETPVSETLDDDGLDMETGENLAEDDDEIPEDEMDDDDGIGGSVSIEVNKLVRPGAAVSGDVVFPSGSKGSWYVDNMGRLGLDLAEGSSKPTQKDIAAFQKELPKALGYDK
ncbi:MAG: hypothetical protein WCS73_13330 [Lentisphaeria bacterium]